MLRVALDGCASAPAPVGAARRWWCRRTGRPGPRPVVGRRGRPHVVPGLFFPPTNPGRDARPGASRPWWCSATAGPTAAAEPGYDPVVQFLTSRGIAVAAVDYRGSTGYGRAYRDAAARAAGARPTSTTAWPTPGRWPRPGWWTADGWPSGAPVPAG